MTRRGFLVGASIAFAFVASNWASMNIGFEYGADTGGCIAFDMLTELPVEEITMCPRANASRLLPARKLWLKMTGDEVIFEEAE